MRRLLLVLVALASAGCDEALTPVSPTRVEATPAPATVTAPRPPEITCPPGVINDFCLPGGAIVPLPPRP